MPNPLSPAQLTSIIQSCKFKQHQCFTQDPATLRFLLNYIKNIKINLDSLFVVKKIIAHFKFPILICFEHLYQQIGAECPQQFQYDFQVICKYAQFIMQGRKFKELSFYQNMVKVQMNGSNKSLATKNISMNRLDINFLNYYQKLSKLTQKIETLTQTCILKLKDRARTNMRTQAHTNININTNIIGRAQQIWKQFGRELANNNFQYYGLMVLENNCIEILKNKFQQLMQHIRSTSQQFQINNSQILGSSIVSDVEESFGVDYCFRNFYDYCGQHLSSQGTNQEYQTEFIKQLLNSNQQSQHLTNSTFNSVIQHPIKQFHLFQPICCRQSFIKDDLFPDFKFTKCSIWNWTQPLYSKQFALKFKTQTCSFLNKDGGFILIGLRHENINNYYYVNGVRITQQQKQDMLIYFRHLMQQIQPDILSSKLYQIDFIPVVEQVVYQQQEKGQKRIEIKYLQGIYIIRIKINYGIRNQIYSFSIGEEEESSQIFAFRNQKEIYYLSGRKVLDLARNLAENSLPLPYLEHAGRCKKPFKGIALYQKAFMQNSLNFHKNQINKSEKYMKTLRNNTEAETKLQQQHKQSGMSVFGMAYDFLIYGISASQLLQIFTSQNCQENICITPITPTLTYIRNLHASSLKQTKKVLKNLRNLLAYRYQKHKIVPLSKNIEIQVPSNRGVKNRAQFKQYLKYIHELVMRNGHYFYSQHGNEQILTFKKSYFAAMAYLDLIDSNVECYFVPAF